jgi:hypothetical protein
MSPEGWQRGLKIDLPLTLQILEREGIKNKQLWKDYRKNITRKLSQL